MVEIKNYLTTLVGLFLTLTFVVLGQAQIPDNLFENMCGSNQAVPDSQLFSTRLFREAEIFDSKKIKYIRLAFHFLLPEETVIEKFVNDCDPSRPTMNYYGAGNFTEYGDGWNDQEYTGYDFAKDLVSNANFELANPSVQWRKDSNSVYPDPADPVRMQYLIAGVYFHRDDDAYYNAGSSIAREISHSKYQVEEERIINIYLTPNLPHSGVANGVGSVIKFVFLNMYQVYKKNGCENWVITSYGPGVINHEIGHCFTLKHSWTGNDGCADTPDGFEYDHINNPDKPTQCYGDTCCKKRANCSRYDPSIPGCPLKPCDEWSKISNNIMDGNSKFPHAYTPDQIDRLHHALMGEGSAYVYTSAGDPPAQAFFNIPKSMMSEDRAELRINTNDEYNKESPYISVEATNPISETLYFDYTSTSSGTAEVFLINISTGQITLVLPKHPVSEGAWSHSADVGQLPPGTYCLSAVINSTLTHKLVVKL